MSFENPYTPPTVWKLEKQNGGAWAGINRPTAGARHEKTLPVGKHPLQLYSMGTPNGQKITILLEELLSLGVSGAEYDAHLIRIGEGDQFGSGFIDISPNAKIPALLDNSTPTPIRIFESGSILLYLAEKCGHFLPDDPQQRTEVLSWLFWQVGAGPFLAGGFGHFYTYAPEKFEYPIDRYTMEVKRQLDVLDRQLTKHPFIAGDTYSIADIAIIPWYGAVVQNLVYNAAEFLETHTYNNVHRWTDAIWHRPAVQRGLIVNNVNGPLEKQLHERHDASDFELKTQDKMVKNSAE